MEFNALIPELYVSDYRRSLAFYRDLLGFKVEYERTEPEFAMLSLDKAQLMIQQQEPTDKHTGALEYPYGRGVNFQIEAGDLKGLVADLKRVNYPLRRDIEEKWRRAGDTLWGELEIQVLDPDGYYLRFSQVIGSKPAN